MASDGIALAAMVILLFPMGFFLLSSPAFLLVKLDIPEVTQLLRGLFYAHFMMVSIAGVIGTVVFAVTGRLGFAIFTGLSAAFATWVRRWFLRRMDAQLTARILATPMRFAGYANCIGAACFVTRSSLPWSWSAFPTS